MRARWKLRQVRLGPWKEPARHDRPSAGSLWLLTAVIPRKKTLTNGESLQVDTVLPPPILVDSLLLSSITR